MATRVEQQTVDYESLNKNDKDLKNLIKEIDQLKDNDLRNDKIEGGVLLENNLNKSLDKTLRHCDKKILNALVTEVGKINLSKGNVEGLNTLVAALNTIKVSRETESLAKFRTKIISGQLDDLNHLDKEDIQNVLDCIDGMSRSDVLKLYSDMTVALQSQHNNFKSTDQKYFYSVYEKIENKVNDGKPLQLNESDVTDAELREIFYDGLQASRLGEIFKQYTTGTDWKGGNIDESFTLKKSETQRFTAKEFADKFNEANDERIKGVDSKVKDLIGKASIVGITVDNVGKFVKDGQEISIEDILGITVTDLKGLDILKIAELQGGHFKDKREEWTKALENKINEAKNAAEAAANAEWKSIEEGQKSSYMDETRINLLNKISFNDKFLRYNTETKDYSYNLNNAKKYLDSLKDKDWTQYFRPLLIYHDRYGKNFENKTDNSDSLAWIAAVQILLNNLPGREEADKLKVDGKLGTETQEKIKDFQSLEKMNDPDGKPGMNTITKLLSKFPETGVSGVQLLSQSGDNNEHTQLNQENENQNTFQRIEGGFQINDVSNKVDFGIDRSTLSYKKNGEDNNLYYQSGNYIVRVSTDTPWIKQKQGLDNSMTLNDDKWTSDVNVCKEGETKLNGVLQTLGITGAKITKSTDNNQYVFENGNTKIMLGEDILTKDFCGKTNIADKMKVVYFASVLGSNGVNFGNENQINNHLMGEYLADWNELNIHDGNANEFVNFYKGGGGPIIGSVPIIRN